MTYLRVVVGRTCWQRCAWREGEKEVGWDRQTLPFLGKCPEGWGFACQRDEYFRGLDQQGKASPLSLQLLKKFIRAKVSLFNLFCQWALFCQCMVGEWRAEGEEDRIWAPARGVVSPRGSKVMPPERLGAKGLPVVPGGRVPWRFDVTDRSPSFWPWRSGGSWRSLDPRHFDCK